MSNKWVPILTSPPTSWFESLKCYIQETDVQCLSFRSMSVTLKDRQLKVSDVSSILEFLTDSQIKEFDFSCNYFPGQIEWKLLILTNLEKLNLSSCKLGSSEILKLMKVLKWTQITDLDISGNRFSLTEDKGRLFNSCLAESKLEALNLRACRISCNNEVVSSFIEALRKTSVTHLNLQWAFKDLSSDPILFLLWDLKHNLITHLNVYECGIGKCDLKTLGDSLRDSNLIELDLSYNGIEDNQVDDLFQALIGSKLTILNLSENRIAGDNNLCIFLEETRIESLTLSGNKICSPKMFSFPNFLRGSSVNSLTLDRCHLNDDLGVPIMKSLKFSKLTHLDVSCNSLTLISLRALADIINDTSIKSFKLCQSFIGYNRDFIVPIGEVSVGSHIEHLNISSYGYRMGAMKIQPLTFAAFFETLVKSSVTSLEMTHVGLDRSGAEAISPILPRTSITRLNLGHNSIGDGVLRLAAVLKSTVLTHLDLESNLINDEGAKALAEGLKETKITDLNLSHNEITCDGALALALSLKDTVVTSLNLESYKFQNEKMKDLAEFTKQNVITAFRVGLNFDVQAALWKNWTLVHQMVCAFKRIAAETTDEIMQSKSAIGISNNNSFLEECLSSYKILNDQPSAASILAREGSIMLSRDEINTFLSNSFPKKMTEFIVKNIEGYHTSYHVELLKKVENMQLNKIVELLLLNCDVYTIDQSLGILHPYVYMLLIKHKIPICNLDIESKGITKIINYYSVHADIEGAADVVSMLKNLRRCSGKDIFLKMCHAFK